MSRTSEREAIVGVIGGMGPAATVRFLDLLQERTPAEEDQDHLRVVVDSNPEIPDRTDYLLNGGSNPLPRLVETGLNVEDAGADVLTLPCNTAHAFYDQLTDALDVPLLHMIGLAADEVAARPADRVGLLATDATIDLGLYHDQLEDRSVELVTPDETNQERVMDALYGVKAGDIERPRSLLVDAVESLDDVDAVIAGCTEVPVALRPDDIDESLVDPMVAMADAAIAYARRELASVP